ncbi:hypothetical protein F4677DRAFT_252835 [Hypoxylon crocopeplum]|nr:hypothetical protein F4677DRAFT_252835 [Hypoxylon crocopeplum]
MIQWEQKRRSQLNSPRSCIVYIYIYIYIYISLSLFLYVGFRTPSTPKEYPRNKKRNKKRKDNSSKADWIFIDEAFLVTNNKPKLLRLQLSNKCDSQKGMTTAHTNLSLPPVGYLSKVVLQNRSLTDQENNGLNEHGRESSLFFFSQPGTTIGCASATIPFLSTY